MGQLDLARSQRRFWQLISAPEGVAPEPAALADFVRGDRGVGPVERLEIYSNAYFARLRDCLAQDFGALSRALGEAGFHDLCKLYLLAHPPAHFSLRYAGAKLPRFLARNRGAGWFRERWPFAPDLAALEWALVDAFDAPDSQVLARDSLARIPAGEWKGLRFEPIPALVLLSLGWPVQRLRQSFDADRAAPPVAAPDLAPEPTCVRVWRRDEGVSYRAIDPLEAEALALVAQGSPFADLCLHVAQSVGDAAAPGNLVSLLEGWLADGLLAGARVS